MCACLAHQWLGRECTCFCDHRDESVYPEPARRGDGMIWTFVYDEKTGRVLACVFDEDLIAFYVEDNPEAIYFLAEVVPV